MSCDFVLVVDDDDDVRDSIGDVLALEGHDIVAVENGEQAIGALAVAMPRAVVTDLSMPMRSGVRIVKGYLRDHSGLGATATPGRGLRFQ
jgi:DNA-binding NtrC family response regulator